ncbi:MAG: hypothetical protein WD004_05510 [Actinomycetota bacterium]
MSLICFFMLTVTPAELHGVNYFTGGLAAFWAVVLGIEELASQRAAKRRKAKDEAGPTA